MPAPTDKPKPRGGDRAARIRAAVAYADFKRRLLGELLDLSVETVSALYAGERPASPGELDVIAEATGVPRAFFDDGFAPIERPLTEPERRLHELEERLARIEAGEAARERLHRLVARAESGEADANDLDVLNEAAGVLLAVIDRADDARTRPTPRAADEPPAPPIDELQTPEAVRPRPDTTLDEKTRLDTDAQRDTGG